MRKNKKGIGRELRWVTWNVFIILSFSSIGVGGEKNIWCIGDMREEKGDQMRGDVARP